MIGGDWDCDARSIVLSHALFSRAPLDVARSDVLHRLKNVMSQSLEFCNLKAPWRFLYFPFPAEASPLLLHFRRDERCLPRFPSPRFLKFYDFSACRCVRYYKEKPNFRNYRDAQRNYAKRIRSSKMYISFLF